MLLEMEDISHITEASCELISELECVKPFQRQQLIKDYIDKRVNSGTIFPDFKPGLDWINVNKPLSFSKELKGKVVVLDFFTYCCINCMHIFPQLKKLENKYSIENGLVVVGVHSPKFPNEHLTANVVAAVRRYEISHPVINNHDEDGGTFSINCWPTLAVVGPAGHLLVLLMGENNEELLNLFVQEALDVFDKQKAISHHSIDCISVHHEFKDSGSLRFPGKVSAINTIDGSLLAISDTGHHRVLVVNNSGDVQHIVGGLESGFYDGSFKEARFHAPQGLVFTDPSTLYVADTENHAIRKIDLAAKLVSTVAGDGTQAPASETEGGKLGMDQQLCSPWDIVVMSPSVLLIAMAGIHQIWAYFLEETTLWKRRYAAGSCAAVVGSGQELNRNNSYPRKAGLAQPSGLAPCPMGVVFVADSESSTVRGILLESGSVVPVVGGQPDPTDLFGYGDSDGRGRDAKLQHPLGVAWSGEVNALFVCDSYNHKLRRIESETFQCTTVTHPTLTLNEPGGLCALGDKLLIADTNNHCIKVVDVNNYSTRVLPIRLEPAKAVRPQVPVVETDTSLAHGCGLLKLIVTVKLPEQVKPLQDTPPVWTLPLPANAGLLSEIPYRVINQNQQPLCL